ncbi:hypothetical protein [Paludibacterium purpuratum]|uniref:Uncharacterized protein n=1 Tax=Paludibacterium purpuratum TaxID=1144873 RepID=A0A4V3DUV6_9NEIS|nr:hypothetical protein [Paludibacterium purpuratum]TDR77807.1 hypothetical protein DFP86_10947 [Paludibacterium purpuratum]
MPTLYLNVGQTANFGAGIIAGTLNIIAPAAGTGTYSLNGGAAVPFALGVNAHVSVAVNGGTISVTNTTAGVQPPAGTLMLSY